ncbi:MAG: hypothetical protein EYC68_09025 [Chloroflexota bacterium]|nr:MAG: hypothetical protein EYC68_09025 [Chloroflexota bacterium]
MSMPSLERINVNFPRPVLDDLRRLVPAKRRSEVIARATARELRRLKVASLFENLARNPAWQAEQYPHLSDGMAIDNFVAQLRASGTYTSASIAATAPTRRKARRE